MKFLITTTFVFLFGFATHALADQPVHQWQFAKLDAYQKTGETTEALFGWAQAEYIEHEGEGLFKRFPEDGKTIQATLMLAKDLRSQATRLLSEGKQHKANALLFAAEATAFYATLMPHLLEERITTQTQAAN